ncbi:HAD-IC family P-type ATPase [Nocardioides daphniae]|uniref:HAD-IC family P-type ATPase n=1 Tax=Nocardioides daphniae TaxID=402297 RepID=UPI00193110D0|nr:HAD-IC family P-type ATPase [Nocardioides daphniae]
MHVFAAPVVEAAHGRQLDLPTVLEAEEMATNGVLAVLGNGEQVRVGKPAFVEEVVGALARPTLEAGETAVYVAVDDELAGVIVLSDPVREHARHTIERLRSFGASEFVLVTGDVAPTARSVADGIGITTVHAETTPQGKVDVVASLQPRPVMMVGDGINDAPVLAAADVGIAMAGRGATAASESASAVVTSDDLSGSPTSSRSRAAR